MAGIRGAGKLYLSINNSGTYTGYMDMSNIASVAIGNTGSDTKTLKSTAPANYGAIIGSATTPGDDTITIKLNAPNRKNLLCAFLGTDTTVDVTGSSVVDEVVTARLQAYVPLAHYPIVESPVPVITNSGNTSTYTENTHYSIDYTNGLFYTIGTISDNQSLRADYTYDDLDGYKIEARTRAAINAKLIFTGENLDSNEIIRVEAESVELTPDGDFSLVSADGEFLEFGLKGVLKVPDGMTSPFSVYVVS
jgi:hypothetical protein